MDPYQIWPDERWAYRDAGWHKVRCYRIVYPDGRREYADTLEMDQLALFERQQHARLEAYRRISQRIVA